MTAVAASASGPAQLVEGRARSLVVAVVMPLMYLLFGITWMGFVPLMPEVLTSTGSKPADAALLVTIISMAKSIVPILAGIVAARLGLSSTLRIAGVLILVGGIAPWLHDYAAVVAVRFLFGVGGAVWVTLMGPVVLAALSPTARPVANAVNGVAVNSGVVIAFAVMLPLSKIIGFQAALSVASLVAALCLGALTFVGKIGDAVPPAAIGRTLKAYGQSLTVSTTWILAVASTGPLALYLVLNTFLGTHLLQSLGAGVDAATARSTASHWR
ncbi:MAG TPA: MFS transporter, partial [Myxococcota bacterium]